MAPGWAIVSATMLSAIIVESVVMLAKKRGHFNEE